MNIQVTRTAAAIGLSLILAGFSMSAQDNTGLAPKTPSKKASKASKKNSERTEALAVRDAVSVAQLNGVVLLGGGQLMTPDEAKAIRGVYLKNVSLLKAEDLEKVVAPYLGRPASLSELRLLQKDIIRFCQNRRHKLLVDVWYPEQKIADGVVQMFLIEGHVGEIRVVNEGKGYFSDKLIRNKFRLKEGDSIDSAKLYQDLDALNQNSFFREVSVSLKVPDKSRLNATDVELKVQERFPLRGFASIEDSGNALVGENRIMAGFNYGNVFGLDHQLNYQYLTDLDFKWIRAHSASYVAPLPWGHTLTVLGTLADLEADLNELTPGLAKNFALNGEYQQMGLRYRVDLPRYRAMKHGVTLGADYKRTDNDLIFGGQSVFNVPVAQLQFLAGYDMTLSDRFGATMADLQFVYSPGEMVGQSGNTNFFSSRVNSDPEYFYSKLAITRETPIARGWDWVARGTVQWTSDRLLATEQIGAGGYSTVRGYSERIVNGDVGYVLNNEIYTPAMTFGLGGSRPQATSGKAVLSDALRFLAFVDLAAVSPVDYMANNDVTSENLASVGVGMRFSFRSNLQLRVDYGFTLTDVYDPQGNINNHGSRVHFGLTASY